MRIGFDFPDDAMPRTIFYESFRAAVGATPAHVADPAEADLLFPLEDTAMETNWPRYGKSASAYVRGAYDEDAYVRYVRRLAAIPRRMCIVNMHPSFRLPQPLASCEQIVIADVNLLTWERTTNPRTIALPALPMVTGRFQPESKRLLASFRGVASHPCREQLARIGNGTSIIVQMVNRDNHAGKIDARAGIIDPAYAELLDKSIFAFVPRGDSEFSYRLLEVMSFGCIPVVIADGLMPPFDRTIAWEALSLHIPENRIASIPTILAAIPARRVVAMQRKVVETYAGHFDGLPRIVDTLLGEVSGLLPSLAPVG